MDDELDEAGGRRDGGELLRALDADGRGDYKRVLLLRFLRDQAKAVGHLTATDADSEVDFSDGVGSSGSGGGDESYHDYLAAALQGADVTEARSLNVQQLHQRRLQLSGGGGGGSGSALPRRSPSARRSLSREMEFADPGDNDGDEHKSSLPLTPRSRLRSEPPPLLLAPEVPRLTRGSVRTLAAASRAGIDSRGVDDCAAPVAAMVAATSRTSVDSRAAVSGTLLGGRKRYGASSPPTGERWISAASAAVAEGGSSGYREAEETPSQARSSLVRLPALFKQPTVAGRALDCGGAARFAGLNKAA